MIVVKPAVGFTLPPAGLSPAPSEKKSQNGEDVILLSGSFSFLERGLTLVL